MKLQAANRAPDFSLPTDGGGLLSLKGLKGQKVVLYFYPKDDTSGCTKEAIAFRDALPEFEAIGVTVIGVSRDNVVSHNKFKEKYDLDFPLVSDTDGTLCVRYGTWVEKSMYGKKYRGIERSTFLVDGEGLIRHVWRKVKVSGHAAEVLATAKEL